MTTQNLWGDLPNPGKVKTPEQILKEQASELTRMTNGKIVGMVVSLPESSNEFVYRLILRTPSLNNYAVGIVEISHSLGFYPTRFNSLIHQNSTYDVTAVDEDSFNAALGAILTSPETRQAITSLLAHINSIDPDAT